MFEPEDSSAAVHDPAQESVLWNEKKAQILQERLAQAMLPTREGKKYYHHDKITPRQMQVCMMSAAGFRNKEICAALGYQPASVSNILGNPDAKKLITTMIGLAADSALDINARIKAYAGEMLDAVVQTTRETRNEKLRSENAFKLLAIGGFTAVEKKEVKNIVQVASDQAENLANAIREAQEFDDDGEVDSAGSYVMSANEVEPDTKLISAAVDEPV